MIAATDSGQGRTHRDNHSVDCDFRAAAGYQNGNADEKTLAVCLPHDENTKYQQMVIDDARKAARKAGFEVDAYFSQGQLITQMKQIYSCIQGEASQRTCAIIAMPVTDNSLNRAAA
jgi:ABC-type sugar transport system substrate-binding protein